MSFIGYNSVEEAVKGRSAVDVKLGASVVNLGEVVAIGYGTQTRREITGSVANISEENFNKGVNRDASDLLQGKVAGLTITSGSGDVTRSSQIQLRGTSTLQNDQGPMIVIDEMCIRDRALSHTGRFSGDLMRFPQIGVEGFIPHDPKSRMGLIEASEVAWQVGQVLSLIHILFGGVLLYYNRLIFFIFVLGSALYAVWVTFFLKKRRLLDYTYFEQRARNQSKTMQLLNGMQEIKLQHCERRRRWEWEDIQADLFRTNIESMRLQQSQEAGSILINEVKLSLIHI